MFQRFTRTLSMSNKKTSRPGQKHRPERSNKSPTLMWPSDEHKVVTFFCKTDDAVDHSMHITPFGKIQQSMLLPKANVILNRIEMSTSAEAKLIWERYKNNLMANVLEVKPDNQKNLKFKKPFYDEFWSKDDIDKGVEDGVVVIETLRINKKNFNFSFVSDKEGKDIVMKDLRDRNRALNGDLVAVKINDRSGWLTGQDGSVSELSNGMDSLHLTPKSSDVSDNSSKSPGSFKSARKTGKVVGILEYNHNRLATGKIEKRAGQLIFKPVSNQLPFFKINNEEANEKISKFDASKVLFTAKIKHWSSQHTFPLGELVDCIGEAGEINAETTSILVDHDVDFQEFNSSVTDCLPNNLPWVIPEDEKAKRRDFTKECIFSIDPSTAKDLDDALHCKKLSDGHFEVGVHIADVSYFVTPKTALDQVASSRCTTVYLVQKAVPMLPSMLCEDLCSLNPGVERLAFSVVWNIDEKGKIYSQWFGRSIIKSCVKFSYDHAQSFIDNPDRDFESNDDKAEESEYPPISGKFSLNTIKSKVIHLHQIAQNLRRQRIDSGALKLDQVRLAYTLDSESGLPNGCYKYSYKKSNELIEEFMLLANISVAHKIYKHLKGQAFLRCHPEPKQDMMEDVVSHCNEIGLEIDATSSEALARTLDEAAGTDDLADCRKQALFMLAIKPQQLAQYFCAGAGGDEEQFRHYALNVPLYTHFTSPIRRYADVIVHRQLAHVLGDHRCSDVMETDPKVLQKQASRCNEKKTNAKAAQEQSVNLFFTILVNNFGPLECRGMVMYVHDHSFDVLSIEYGVVQRVYVDSLSLLSFKSVQTKQTGKDLKVNVLKLKWPKGDMSGIEKVGLRPPNYDDCETGIEQTIEVFDIVDLVLYKHEPHSLTKFNAKIKRPQKI